jgi:hypothetical protein
MQYRSSGAVSASGSRRTACASSRRSSRRLPRTRLWISWQGIARPEQPREPKQSLRAQAPHAWMWAIPGVRCPARRRIRLWQSTRPGAALVTIPVGRMRSRANGRHSLIVTSAMSPMQGRRPRFWFGDHQFEEAEAPTAGARTVSTATRLARSHSRVCRNGIAHVWRAGDRRSGSGRSRLCTFGWWRAGQLDAPLAQVVAL